MFYFQTLRNATLLVSGFLLLYTTWSQLKWERVSVWVSEWKRQRGRKWDKLFSFTAWKLDKDPICWYVSFVRINRMRGFIALFIRSEQGIFNSFANYSPLEFNPNNFFLFPLKMHILVLNSHIFVENFIFLLRFIKKKSEIEEIQLWSPPWLTPLHNLYALNVQCIATTLTQLSMYAFIHNICAYFGSSFATAKKNESYKRCRTLCMNVYGNTEYGMFSYTRNTNWNKCSLWRMLYDQKCYVTQEKPKQYTLHWE